MHAIGQREHEAQDEKRLHQGQRSSSKRQELEEVADAVEGVSDEPPRAARQAHEEPARNESSGGSRMVGLVLEHRRHPVRRRAGQRQQDDGHEAAPDVVVEDPASPERATTDITAASRAGSESPTLRARARAGGCSAVRTTTDGDDVPTGRDVPHGDSFL